MNDKEEIKARKAIKTTCVCGTTYCKDAMARHIRSQKHNNYLATIVENGTSL